MRGLQRAMQPLRDRVQLMISRAIVLLANDKTKLQGLQISLLAEEVRDDAERFQQYGFTSHPHPGAEAVVAAVGGNRDHVLVLSVDDRRYRLRNLDAGEVALYTDQGDKIVLKRGGVVQVTAATRVELISPEVHCSGSLVVGGTVTAAVDVVAAGKSLVHHRHPPGTPLTGEPA